MASISFILFQFLDLVLFVGMSGALPSLLENDDRESLAMYVASIIPTSLS